MDDCLIIGGGVVGLSIAYELASSGMQCCVVDQNEMGRSASWAGAGILPPASNVDSADSLERLRSLSHRLHSQWAERLQSETGIDNGFRRCGGIYLGRTAAEVATLRANELWWDENKIEFKKLSQEELEQRVPGIYGDDQQSSSEAWLLPDECQLRNPRHLKALAAGCEALAVRLVPHKEIKELTVAAGQISAAQTVSGPIFAKNYCIANGAWSRYLLESAQINSGVMPIRGQMLLYKTSSILTKHIINEGHRYIVQREDGHLLVGSNEEEAGYRIETTEPVLTELERWAHSVFPSLNSQRPARSWAGLRPGSFDTYPYIGQSPKLKNLYVATGHFRAGLHLSCATAVIIRQLLTGQQPIVDIRPFKVGRG